MGLFGGNHFNVDGKTALITGASEGMGLEVAKQLAAKGANVVLVSRSERKLQAALEQVQAAAKNPSAQRFRYIPADVSQPSYAAPLIAEATAWNGGRPLDVVWCIAGTSTPELFLDMDMASLRRQMDINFFGAAEMCHGVLGEWLAPGAPVEREPRHLVVTLSVAALYSIPGYAPYAPSKAALRALMDTLAQEVLLYPQNVRLSLVFPGTILSPGFANESLSKPEITKVLEKSDPQQQPAEAAEAAIRGLERGDHYVTVAWLGWLMKAGSLGGAIRNNWLVDILGAWLVSIVWIFVQADLHGTMRAWGKKHGHPSTWKKAT
ncbi:hypothetical protein B0I35DRAFT_448243 [Stachybotrys elegans]|uniref:3-dehydrosphinganine reductase n=1 Tax=Stachybotrys elegans TaxID=80388 RepID=A0A8K0WXK5_9HYPO|nr:hypothetical protein B0I35DRAFT_448243 [Stachybotrys elegans]